MVEENKTYKALGETIKAKREELKMTQDELAQKISVTAATISLYESGLRKPEMNKIKSLLHDLRAALQFLTILPMGIKDYPSPQEFARIMAHIFGDGCLSVSKKGYFNLSYFPTGIIHPI